MIEQLTGLIGPEKLAMIARAITLLIIGLVLASLGGRLSGRLARRRMTVHGLQLLRRAVFFVILGIFLAAALNELGFSIGVIMGAAGVLTVAIAFAAQTTASNLISGLFLIGEHSFEVGDIIRVGNTTGQVLSVDALSVKLRTFDNLFVRIPNESLIKSEVTTLTRFPIRRLDLMLGVAYKEDIDRVHDVLMAVADRNLLCLDEPAPLFIFTGFGESQLDIQFSIWARRENFIPLKNSVTAEIKRAFDEAGIEIPFPHRSLYAGEATGPFPVTIVDRTAAGDDGSEDTDR